MMQTLKNWEIVEGDWAEFRFPADQVERLDEAGLGDIVEAPDAIFDLDVDFERLGTGGMSRAYTVNDSDVVIKKYFKSFWCPGERRNRAIPHWVVIANLAVNVAFERALADDPFYATPAYLGALSIYADHISPRRNYILMTRLDFASESALSTAQASQFDEFCNDMPRYARLALLRDGVAPTVVKWKEAKPFVNLRPICEGGVIKVGIIDQEASCSRYPVIDYGPPRHYWQDADPVVGNL